MGCDIHFFTEVKQPDGSWASAPDNIVDCSHCGGTGFSPGEFRCASCNFQPRDHNQVGKCLYSPGMLDIQPVPCPDWYECKNGKTVEQYYKARDYAVFAALAGVRGPPVRRITIEERGLPEDMAYETAKYMESEDLHSHGYYTLAELLRHKRWWLGNHPFFYETIKKLMTLDKDPHRVRVVFAFDN
jgi:hypothetical protein